MPKKCHDELKWPLVIWSQEAKKPTINCGWDVMCIGFMSQDLEGVGRGIIVFICFYASGNQTWHSRFSNVNAHLQGVAVFGCLRVQYLHKNGSVNIRLGNLHLRNRSWTSRVKGDTRTIQGVYAYSLLNGGPGCYCEFPNWHERQQQHINIQTHPNPSKPIQTISWASHVRLQWSLLARFTSQLADTVGPVGQMHAWQTGRTYL